MSLKAGLVVDPVMVSTSGDVLAGPSILTSFRYAIHSSELWFVEILFEQGKCSTLPYTGFLAERSFFLWLTLSLQI